MINARNVRSQRHLPTCEDPQSKAMSANRKTVPQNYFQYVQARQDQKSLKLLTGESVLKVISSLITDIVRASTWVMGYTFELFRLHSVGGAVHVIDRGSFDFHALSWYRLHRRFSCRDDTALHIWNIWNA